MTAPVKINWRMVLVELKHEAIVVFEAASSQASGAVLTDEDFARLRKAAKRMENLVKWLGCDNPDL